MLDIPKIVATLKFHNVKPGMPGWYGITDFDPNDEKKAKRLDTFRPDPEACGVGVLGAIGLSGPAARVPSSKEGESATIAASIMAGAQAHGFETVEQIDAFAAGFDGIGTAEKSKDAAAFRLGQEVAKQV